MARTKAKREYVKFGYQQIDGGFGLIARDEKQARMLAEIAAIQDERISSFGPVTKDDSLTAVLWIRNRTRRERGKDK